MDMQSIAPTRGQLERQLSQSLQSMYRSQFGHLPTKVICHIFDDKIAIVAEDTLTIIEKILIDSSRLELARETRLAVSEIFATTVKQTVADILRVNVADVISDSVSASGRLGMLVFLEQLPITRLAKKELAY